MIFSAFKQFAERTVNSKSSTNCIKTANTSNTAEVEGEDLKVGDFLNVDAATGYLKKGTNSGEMVWEVSKVYTMADGQPAVKIVRIK